MELSIYIHVPFCTKKCPYCHFYVIPNQPRYHDLLTTGLKLEWEMQQEKILPHHRIVSIYFGGGTPSLLSTDAIRTVIDRFRPLPDDCEITIEANPEDSSPALFQALKEAGITRLSFGVQSLDDRSLSILGRAHSAVQAKKAVHEAALAGFTNISIDLMYDLPDQTESSWRATLDQIKDLPIQHLSLYNLTIEPHTSFYKQKDKLIQPKPKTSLRLLSSAIDTLESLGFERYEISAFAKKEFESRHNLGYWTFRPFLGFGPSAFSYWNGERFQNTPNLQRYAKALQAGGSPVHFRETLPYPDNLNEQIAVGLRMKGGCRVPDGTPEKTRDALVRLERMGLVLLGENRAQLTEKGKLFYDSVAVEIV